MEPFLVLQVVVSTLEKLDIPYMLVGSFASSSQGVTRFTQDADLIIKLSRSQIDRFIEAFSPDFYVDRGMIQHALTSETSFNVVHFESSFKIDFFVLRRNRYSEEDFSRRALRQISPRPGFEVYVQTPEDTLLSKLRWFRQGGEVSENQWRDVIGILKVQAGHLEMGYLRKWAEEIGVSDLLAKASREAEGGGGSR
jgi:hypothetical protein